MHPAEVAATIEQLKNKHSQDANGISNYFLKNLALELAIPLTHIYNLSMEQGKFPSNWKKSLIIPVFKNKGDKMSVANYRPIAMIHGLAKIFEHLSNIF